MEQSGETPYNGGQPLLCTQDFLVPQLRSRARFKRFQPLRRTTPQLSERFIVLLLPFITFIVCNPFVESKKPAISRNNARDDRL